MTQQSLHLERVTARIGVAILDYCRSHRRFYMSELVTAVEKAVGACAPDSPSRILRVLRKQGRIAYSVDRAQSLYTIHEAA